MAPEHTGQDAQLLFERGQEQLRAGDFHEAVECFTRAIRLIPHVHVAYQLRAMAYLEMGQRIDALNDLDQAIRLNANDARLFADRAKVLYRQRAYEPAITDCQKALQLDASMVELFGLRGECYAALGDSAKAFIDFAEAIERDTQHKPEHLLSRADLNMELEEFDAALEDCNAALAIKPDHLGVLQLRGLIYRAQQKIEESLADLTRVLDADATKLGARIARASILLSNKQYQEALADIELCVPEAPELGKVYELRGLCRKYLNDLTGALDDFNRAIELQPQSAHPYNMRAGIYYLQEEYRKALQDHLDALKREPKSAGTFNQLAWLWCTTPHPDVRNGLRAKECATRACELSEWQEPSYLDTLAAAYAECGEFELAIQWMQKAIAMIPEEQLADYQQRLDLYENNKPYRIQPSLDHPALNQ